MGENKFHRIYGGNEDPRDFPAYPISVVARYVGVNYHRLYHWVRPVVIKGINGDSKVPVIKRPVEKPNLSFNNLIEAHIVRAFLYVHNGSLKDVRIALDYAEREMNIERLLLHPDLKVGAGGLFLEEYGKLINLSRAGQIALRKSFDKHIERIDFDNSVLFPFTESDSNNLISISPYVAFGKPIISRAGVSTEVLAERVDLGEDPGLVAEDYGLKIEEVEEAILYEQRAA